MCGIWCLSTCGCDNGITETTIYKAFDSIKHRGPDNSVIKRYETDGNKIDMGFHRLAIIDPSNDSNQPIESNGCVLICNGEIYNYQKLNKKYGFNNNVTNSDCEVILNLYIKLSRYDSHEYFTRELDGEFAFILYDRILDIVIVGRDAYGVRPLFFASGVCDVCNKTSYNFSSELKGLLNCFNNRSPFTPGELFRFNISKLQELPQISFHKGPGDGRSVKQWTKDSRKIVLGTEHHFDVKDYKYTSIEKLLTKAVNKRMHSDRPIGCLLSGGLDSSLVCGIASKIYGKDLPVFTIGFPGSVDVIAAKKVAEYIGLTNHHIVEITHNEALECIEEVVRTIESYDVTTVRASVPQFLLAKYISTNTNIKAILTGEGADELFGGYRYFKGCIDAYDFLSETEFLLREIYMYDGLRTDRTMARFGLEVRVPFLDKNLVHFVFNDIKPSDKMHFTHKGVEKYVLRKAFSNANLIPDVVLWRKKEAFSDAISSTVSDSSSKELWMNVLKNHISNKVSEEEFETNMINYLINLPPTKEAYYYRTLFNSYYTGYDNDSVIKHYWMPNPKFVKVENWDPSATILN